MNSCVAHLNVTLCISYPQLNKGDRVRNLLGVSNLFQKSLIYIF